MAEPVVSDGGGGPAVPVFNGNRFIIPPFQTLLRVMNAGKSVTGSGIKVGHFRQGASLFRGNGMRMPKTSASLVPTCGLRCVGGMQGRHRLKIKFRAALARRTDIRNRKALITCHRDERRFPKP